VVFVYKKGGNEMNKVLAWGLVSLGYIGFLWTTFDLVFRLGFEINTLVWIIGLLAFALGSLIWFGEIE